MPPFIAAPFDIGKRVPILKKPAHIGLDVCSAAYITFLRYGGSHWDPKQLQPSKPIEDLKKRT